MNLWPALGGMAVVLTAVVTYGAVLVLWAR